MEPVLLSLRQSFACSQFNSLQDGSLAMAAARRENSLLKY
jgi:hypothetical protein